MSGQQLAEQAIALPLSERLSLAQALWQSIDTDLLETSEGEALRDAVRRDDELSAGAVEGRAHEDVMRVARRAVGCV